LPATGDIVVIDFPGVQGTKRSPAIILSTDEYHRTRPDVIAGLITSQIGGATGPSDYILADWQAAGLHRPSAFRAFLVTVPRSAISASIGRPVAVDWDGIRNSLNAAIAR
jgi:mRNA interferase MazF